MKHTESKREVRKRLGETSDEYLRREPQRDPNAEMTEGQDFGRTVPDVVAEAPGGMNEEPPPEVHRGFADERERRDR